MAVQALSEEIFLRNRTVPYRAGPSHMRREECTRKICLHFVRSENRDFLQRKHEKLIYPFQSELYISTIAYRTL